jgi:hypothetical protein
MSKGLKLFSATCSGLLALSTFVNSVNAQVAATPYPSIQIVGFTSIPSNTCTDPFADVDVAATGNASTSDNFEIFANGALIYTWDGETMSWVNPSVPISSYGMSGASGVFSADSTITGRITSFAGANQSASNPTTGQVPVYVSEVSWNCTTGVQVGEIVNRDLRETVAVTALAPNALVVASLLLGLIGLRIVSQREDKIAQRAQ